ncbi:hypothetical protein Mal15_27800 [Stieleria maiorica]|uniref:O-antigen polysaccharide polymerase Wzy n=1 Tax=Stieleria maiorica TaxID=2795974 RepID=A0A5B9MGR7_9BACT|nr:oligosaccharide repeat unit polymerase [Stieleria maiorica]QEF98725.1 hypothetical protein Mal15_27800 [Stieleria maiorica]
MTVHQAIATNPDEDDENPFVEISESVQLLARLSIVMAIAFAWWVGLNDRDSAPYPISRLLLFTLYTAIQTLPLWYRLPGVGLLHPLYVIAAYLFLKGTIPSLSQSAIGYRHIPGLPAMSAQGVAIMYMKVTGLYILAQIFTYFGFFTGRGIRWNFIEFRNRPNIVTYFVIASLVIGLVAFWLLIDLSGGLYPHLKNITRGNAAKVWVKDASNASIYATLCGLIVLPPAFLMLVGKNPGFNPVFWALTAISIAVNYLTAGRRSAIVSAVIIIVACWVLRTRTVSLARLSIIWFLLFLSIGIFGEYRRSNWDGRRRVNFSAFQDNDIGEAMEKTWSDLQQRRGGSPVPLIVYRVPKYVPFKYGMNYVGYINRFIPRRIWKNKPKGLATQCAEVFYGRYGSGAIPMGALGEAYWSGGIVAIPIVFFVWGRILCSIGTFYIRFRYSAIACMLYLLTVTRLEPSELSFGRWVYVVVPTLIILFAFGELVRARHPDS